MVSWFACMTLYLHMYVWLHVCVFLCGQCMGKNGFLIYTGCSQTSSHYVPCLVRSHHFIPQGHAAKPWWCRAQWKLDTLCKKMKKGILTRWLVTRKPHFRLSCWTGYKTFTVFSSTCRLFNYQLPTDIEFCIEPQYGLVFIAFQSVTVAVTATLIGWPTLT